jgi:GTP cyclohydrolase I
MENNRRKFHNDIECVKTGLANGAALDRPLTDEEKQLMIEEATEHFGNFLSALKCDWKNDPNSADTPRRVAKAYVNDLWAGRYNGFTDITSFP